MSDLEWWKKLKVGDRFLYGERNRNKECQVRVDKLESDCVYATLLDGSDWQALGSIKFSNFGDFENSFRDQNGPKTLMWYTKPLIQSFNNQIRKFLLNNDKINFKEQLENV